MIKNILKRAITICCAVLLFIGCGTFLNYILVDDTKSFTRIMFHQMYYSPKNIDIVFLGSSHVYRALIPEITDKVFGKYTFNAGTSSQALDGSFALLQEICACHKPEQVYLELYYAIADAEEYKDREQMVATYIVSDYMRPSFRKFEYLVNASADSHYVNSFIPARRNWHTLFQPKYIYNLIKKKQSEDYKNYRWVKDNKEYYVDRGFVANDEVVDPDEYWNKLAYGNIEKAVKLTEKNDWYRSLKNIITYCKKNNIKLTLFVVPEPEWTLVGKGNYQKYHDMVQTIADSNEIGFYDFNFCKSQFFDTRDYKLFKDEHHLNTVGAKEFSKLFSRFFTGQLSREALFYSSFAEKLAEEKPTVYGFAGLNIDSKQKVRNGYIISNREQGLEYKIEIVTAESKKRILQDFSKNKNFTLPLKEKGVLKVSWRLENSPEQIFTLETGY
ncbi:MAG: hypothetical protein IKZ43_09500 [Acidaminococcaceae bacterium]|nr:hypothetical protein [Acidaminococcaceae bacterium]